MACHDLQSPEEVYPKGQWAPCTSYLVCHRSSGSPESDGIALEKYIHPSKRRKYRSYRSIGSIEGAEMSPYPPPPLPKSKRQIQEERIQKRMEKLAKKIRNYHAILYDMPNATQYPENTLFVARLSRETTEETLKKEFLYFGQNLDIKLVRDKEGHSRGYAFIEFSNEDDLRNALELASEMIIDGQKVLLDTERGRVEIGWIPRRLGGGLGVNPQKSKKKSRRELRQMKMKKAKARKAGVTNDPNAGSNSQDTQNTKKPGTVNKSKKLEDGSKAANDSQGKITAKKPNRKKKSATKEAVQPSESSTNTVADFSNPPPSTHLQPASHQSVQEIPATGGVQFQQSYQYSQPQMHYNYYTRNGTTFYQPPIHYNPATVQGTSNAQPVNYYYQPSTGITYPSYSNVSYSYHQNPVYRYQNTAATSQNYRLQSPNLPVSQPTYQNYHYPPPNWRPRFYIQYYQIPTTSYQVQQSVPQTYSQVCPNNNVEPENQPAVIPQANDSAIEDSNVPVVSNEAPQIDPHHPTE